MTLLGFCLGVPVGVLLGVFVMALLVMAADDRERREHARLWEGQ